MHARIIYRLNSRDEIVFVNEEWESFALTNDASTLAPELVLGRTLWDFIRDETTEHLYREVLRGVRAGGSASFTFRCDAPERRRFMEMTITALDGGEVQFISTTHREEERPVQILFDRSAPRAGSPLRACGWCKRIDVGDGEWMEVEMAIRRMCLFENRDVPPLTHGICAPCREVMRAKLAELKGRN